MGGGGGGEGEGGGGEGMRQLMTVSVDVDTLKLEHIPPANAVFSSWAKGEEEEEEEQKKTRDKGRDMRRKWGGHCVREMVCGRASARFHRRV